MKKDSLFLFTNEYPYGNGETFIENELAQHLKHFKTIKIFPLIKKENFRVVDKNISVVDLYDDIGFDSLKTFRRNFFNFCKLIIKEFYYSNSKVSFLRQLPIFKSSLLQNFKRAEILKQYLVKEDELKNVVLYSFWTDDWATILSILKKQDVISDFISRVHGYDLYAERWPDSIIPFRNLQIENVSKIFAVSNDGLAYLQENYPEHKNKFYLNHLSIFDHGIGPFDSTAVFTIVSCSNLNLLKRVHLIAELLSKISFRIKWVHFGEGVEKDRILNVVKKMPDNITVELRGSVANSEIIKYYQDNSVNVFIHLSETEGGVPLALQEAASFGIPLIGTMAGGAAEIINEKTGIPLSVNFDADYLVAILNDFKESNKNSIEFRKGVRAFWLNSFSLDTNYIKLYNNIAQ